MDIPEIDIDALAALDPTTIVLIDVRRPDEYEEGHVPGARLLTLAELPDRVGEAPEDGVIYMICAVGSRSLKAAEFLSGQGRNAVNVSGGTKAWIEAGHDVARGMTP